VPPEWFETPGFREVYEALCRSPESIGSPVFFEQLSPTAQRAYTYLAVSDPKYGQPDPDRTYDGAFASLKTRVLRRELTVLEQQMEKIPSDEYDTLIKRRKSLLAQIAAENPEELVKRQHRGGKRDAR
jgi:hypothetical protein